MSLMPLNYALKNGEYGYIFYHNEKRNRFPVSPCPDVHAFVWSLYPHVLMFMLLCDHCIPMSWHSCPWVITSTWMWVIRTRLTNGIQQRWGDVTPMTAFTGWLCCSGSPCWLIAVGETLMARNCRWLLGAEGDIQSAASRKVRPPRSYGYKEVNSANTRAYRWILPIHPEPPPGDPLIIALWVSLLLKTQLSHGQTGEPQKLWDKVLFQATNFVVICYTPIANTEPHRRLLWISSILTFCPRQPQTSLIPYCALEVCG